MTLPLEGFVQGSRGRQKIYLLDYTLESEALILAIPTDYTHMPPGTFYFPDLKGVEEKEWVPMDRNPISNPFLHLHRKELPGGHMLFFLLEEKYSRKFYERQIPVLLPGDLSEREEREAVSTFFLRLRRVVFPDEVEKKALRFPTVGGRVLWVVSI